MSAYLDHAATTPMRPEALDAYLRAASGAGNPGSVHGPGQRARAVLEQAREELAGVLGCEPVEVVFTSGGTESINLAIKGLFWARRPRTAIVVPEGEHHATLDSVEWLVADQGARARWVALDATGVLDAGAARAAMGGDGGDVALATASLANNEVGSLAPARALAADAADARVPLHLDAVAALGHVAVDFRALRGTAPAGAGLVALSVSAHKVGGPIGAGALVVERGTRITPLSHGGGQQRGLRSGTEDVPAAASFAAAAVAAERDRLREAERLDGLVARLWAGIRAAVPEAVLNGAPLGPGRVPGNLNVGLPGRDGESLLFLLDAAGVAASLGSACQAGVARASHVLLAMGRSEREARAALRLTLGWSTTEADVDAFLAALPEAAVRARA